MTDTNALLAPIDGADPCGTDMVFSAEFDAIREARRHDDPRLDQGEWITDVKEADWGLEARICAGLLRERTKDLRVAGWLMEGWAQTRGFAGLADGLRLLDGLCQRYWEGLYPRSDGDDAEQRVGNLAWALARAEQLARELPLTQSDEGRYGALVWAGASQLANAIRRTPDQAAELVRGRITLEQFDTARGATPPAFYAELQAQLQACLAAVDALETTIDARVEGEGPAFSPLRDALREVQELVQRFAREAGLLPTAPAPAPAEPAPAMSPPEAQAADAVPAAGSAPAPAPRGPIQTRAQALAALREVAEFFRRTEPHSPVAYLADKAANWGEMSLHLWLRTVMKNEDALANLEELLGVPRSSEGN